MRIIPVFSVHRKDAKNNEQTVCYESIQELTSGMHSRRIESPANPAACEHGTGSVA
jgi:hypothetical protein